jgi:lipoyl(octanoyl) transferase
MGITFAFARVHKSSPESITGHAICSLSSHDRRPLNVAVVEPASDEKRMTRPIIEWAISSSAVPYPDAIATMTSRAAAVATGKANEMIWLLEHPALYTAGTSAKPQDLLEPNLLPVFDAGRGGQYTYHGPGQRIAYVMLNLKKRGGDVRALVHSLEYWVVEALQAFNVHGETRADRVGIWVSRAISGGARREDKIAALGLRVSRGVTTHGISLNVEPDLRHYRGIVACGIQEHGVTSLADLGLPVTMPDADIALRRAFEKLFGPVTMVAAPQFGVSRSNQSFSRTGS